MIQSWAVVANERNELILKSVIITQDDERERLPFIEAQAEVDLAERPRWDETRVIAAILSDVKDWISLDEQKFTAENESELIYQMIPSVMSQLRSSNTILTYLEEKKQIDTTTETLRKEKLNSDGSEYIRRNQAINERKKQNSRLLENFVNMNAERVLQTMTQEQKNQYGQFRRDAEKQRQVTGLLNGQFHTNDTLPLVLSTDKSAETAEIWGDLNTPLVSETKIDLLGALFHAAVSSNGESQPTTKGFIHNRTYWLGVQPYMTLSDTIITEIKQGIRSGSLSANEGLMNDHIDLILVRLSNSLQKAKKAFDNNDIDSALFLVLSIQRDANGLKTGAHYECFQITRDPENRNKFVLHESNSSLTQPICKPVTKIESIPNNAAMQYVLAQANKAGYDVSTLRANTVYRQATSMGCGICAMQTAIDSVTKGQSISDLAYHEGSDRGKKYSYILETELRLSQMAILFNSPDPDVQRKLMMGAASQYIHLKGQTEEVQPAPSGKMLKEYLPPTVHASASHSFSQNSSQNNLKHVEVCFRLCGEYEKHLLAQSKSELTTKKLQIITEALRILDSSTDNTTKIRHCCDLFINKKNVNILAERRDDYATIVGKQLSTAFLINIYRVIKWSFGFGITEGDKLRHKVMNEITKSLKDEKEVYPDFKLRP